MRTALRNPVFRSLAVSYGINDLGDVLGVVALAVLVYDRTGSALATAALFVAGKFVPAFLAPAFVARLDRHAVRRVLPALYVAEAAAFAALAVSAGHFALAAVLALAFADGVIALVARAISRAAVVTVTAPYDGLRGANATINVIFAVTSALGPALAGVLVATAGVSATLAIDAASFAAIAVLLAATPGLPSADVETPEERWSERVRAGIAYVRDHSVVRTLVSAQTLGFVFFFLVIPIEVVYAQTTLHAGSTGFGALLASWGAGMVVGSALYARSRHRPTAALVGVSTLLVGAGYLGMAAAPGIVTACVASAVGGVGNGVQWVSVLTAVQEAVDEAFQARVVGLLESSAAAAPGIGYVLGGALSAAWSPRVAYLVAGIGVVLVAAGMTRRLATAGAPA